MCEEGKGREGKGRNILMYLFEIGTLSCFFIHVYGCGEAFPECWVAGNSHFFLFFLVVLSPLRYGIYLMFASWKWLCEGALRHPLVVLWCCP